MINIPDGVLPVGRDGAISNSWYCIILSGGRTLVLVGDNIGVELVIVGWRVNVCVCNVDTTGVARDVGGESCIRELGMIFCCEQPVSMVNTNKKIRKRRLYISVDRIIDEYYGLYQYFV
jgi:hypothetical protein